MCFEIRQSVHGDLPDALKLDKEAFGKDAWTILDYISVFSDPSICRLTAVTEGKFAGFAAAELDEENRVYLLTLAVRPEFRRKGIGAALLGSCEDAFEASGACLFTDDQNQAAIGLYESAGYRTVGRIPGYYMNGHDALIMEKTWNDEK